MRLYASVTAAIFMLVAALHLMRVAFGWPANIGGYEIPLFVSSGGVIIAGSLAYWGFQAARKL